MEICPKCGLPKEACICGKLIRSRQKIKIIRDKRRFGKIVTVVSGFDDESDLREIAKELKSELACGGTYKDKKIELQGDQVKKAKQKLINMEFEVEDM
ncbi:stress response translation initiation inhibitor YciH [Candidatus Pacearchaeota archaeon CG_4_9_14_3_um_filter_31_7]|nr:MAG: translation initiation factor [Candidatus Pacearchaeota archaeon CG1_02_31_27]PIN92366.1 MAG: stress response translation initiation inhibitor YciH [Candidatus Pacearchaeota archaeon CG10_big_fil_rev_8_21_14_0_10_31_59]PIZ80668.1 MAG: stress response translation initiation inhibitor YciH [Candidatus Pacearchaeota archaeon CG_4_10_14_0_2_um_filter_31_10]PJA70807.1 MAG: stress response translation initiation inhibitor YciH [Candidatus Pacearchaeota archaeon CG_4_9_14_3_um_filter_31_7]